MNQFNLTTPLGERYGTLMDLPLTRAGELTLIMALREGFTVTFEKNGTTPESKRAAAPVATRAPRVAKRGKPGPKPKKAVVFKSTNPADDKYHVGDTVYLAWSEIEAKNQVRMSQYRTTKGVVVEFQSGFRSIGVRFNGDPETIWFKRVELARVPEVSG